MSFGFPLREGLVIMNEFRPPVELIVHETDHWLVNQRIDSALPGYLIYRI